MSKHAPTDQVRVWSVLPHPYTVTTIERVTVHGELAKSQPRRVTLQRGDNVLSREDWALLPKQPSVAHKVREGWLGEGRFADLPSDRRAKVWDGSKDKAGSPILTPQGTDWTRLLSPLAARVTDQQREESARRVRGIFSLIEG